MNRVTLSLWTLTALVAGSVNVALSQELPRTQPKLLTMWREEVKIGHADEHAKHEAGFVAAFEKAKSPYYYLALTSLTGPSEAWYIIPWDSYAAIADSMKREAKDPVLSAELSRLALADAKYLDGLRILQAHARAELSAGEFPDLAKARFFSITVYRVRPGHEPQFEAAATAYGAARARVAPKHGFRVYQIVAGLPSPTFLIFSSVEKYEDFDATTAAHQATLKALTAEEESVRQKFQTEGVISSEMNRFKLDPTQSYVSKETRATDPEFWSPK
jgi:hypothetical protein